MGRTVCDWRHYLAVIQRKPGALRNGAPFAELPDAFGVGGTYPGASIRKTQSVFPKLRGEMKPAASASLCLAVAVNDKKIFFRAATHPSEIDHSHRYDYYH